MADAVRIRAYARADRAAVRRLCGETALRGEPVDPLFSDREVVADLLTRYYTDYEPAASWVAEQDGRVVGYLIGCLNTRRFRRLHAVAVVPQAVCCAIARGALWRRETWRLLDAGLRTWRLSGVASPAIPREYAAAHLHINLDRQARGQHFGERLIAPFLRRAAAAQCAGVHASVRGDNSPARRFFERLGFAPVARTRVVWPAGVAMEAHETIVYGKRL